MRLNEIINTLPSNEVKVLLDRFVLQPNQLETYLSQEHTFSQNYRALSKRLRQIFDYIFENERQLNISQLTAKFRTSKHDLKLLEERGLLFVLPTLEKPQKVVIPLEYLFLREVTFPSPKSLASAIRHYDNTHLFRLANFYEVSALKPYALYAARIYEQILKSIDQQQALLNDIEWEILHYVIDYGGQISIDRFMQKFSRQMNTFHSSHRPLVDDFFGVRQLGELSALQKLFIKGFLIFVKSEPPEPNQEIAIPLELFSKLAQHYLDQLEQQKSELCRQMESPTATESLQSNAAPLTGDIKKLLLLVENISPRMTHAGIPFKTDLKRMLQLLQKEKKYWLFLFHFANWLGILDITSQQFKTNADSTNFLNLFPQDHYLLTQKFLKEKAFQELESNETSDNRIHSLIIYILERFKNKTVNSRLFYEYARFVPEFITLYEDYATFPTAFSKKLHYILKRYFWLNLIDASPDFNFIRLSEAGQYAICGMLSQFKKTNNIEDKFIIQPNYEIIADSNLPFEILLKLAQITTIISLDVTIRFQINTERLTNALQAGESVQEIQEFLESNSKTPLPQTVKYLLNELENKEGEVTLVPVSGYLLLKEPQLFEQAKVLLRDYIFSVTDGDKLLLKPGLDLRFLEQLIKKRGFLLKSHLEEVSEKPLKTQRLNELLDSIEPPPFNIDELTFDNPAGDPDNIKKLLQFALTHQLKVKIEYYSDTYSSSTRKIELQRVDENIIEAYCHSLEMTRAFRVDRIREAELLR